MILQIAIRPLAQPHDVQPLLLLYFQANPLFLRNPKSRQQSSDLVLMQNIVLSLHSHAKFSGCITFLKTLTSSSTSQPPSIATTALLCTLHTTPHSMKDQNTLKSTATSYAKNWNRASSNFSQFLLLVNLLMYCRNHFQLMSFLLFLAS